MKLLTFTPETQGATSRRRRDSRRSCTDDAELWRRRCWSSSSTTPTSWPSWCWPRADVPAELVRKVLREATLHQLHRAGALRLGAGLHRHPAAAGRGGLRTCPARPTCRRSKAINPKKKDAKELSASPTSKEPFCGLVFKIQAGQHGDLHFVRVYSGALKAGSRVLESRQGQEGERHPALAHPGRPPRGAGRAASRPATSSASSACGTRSPATRSATRSTRSCWSRSSFPETVISMAIEPESSRRAQEAARHAGDAQAAGPDASDARKRGDRPDAHQRHGRAAPGGHQAPAAARLQPERQGPQAARQLSRDDPARRRGRRASAIARSPARRSSPRCGCGWSRSRRARSRSPCSMPPKESCPSRTLNAVLEYLRERGDGGGSSAIR